ncbi:MAG: hypothetical protein ACD_22C00220G0003 [uncultured bacterium]|nr:MAG: hypothetical protein ACD_22C00220G0003 [uncultured bacterium]
MVNQKLLNKAFKILRRNYGCPGLDGISIKEIKHSYKHHLKAISSKITRGEINTLPVKIVPITDYRGNTRNVFVYCVYERWIQAYLKLQIEPMVEKLMYPYVYGYRRGLDGNMLNAYITKNKMKRVLHIDIEKFFDNIDTNILCRNLSEEMYINKALLIAIQKTIWAGVGLPQGNVLSPILSNLYLNNLDQHFPTNYARFSDDMYFAFTDPKCINPLVSKVTAVLSKLNLTINFKKVEILDAKKMQ